MFNTWSGPSGPGTALGRGEYSPALGIATLHLGAHLTRRNLNQACHVAKGNALTGDSLTDAESIQELAAKSRMPSTPGPPIRALRYLFLTGGATAGRQ
jgi:hypothetical protein